MLRRPCTRLVALLALVALASVGVACSDSSSDSTSGRTSGGGQKVYTQSDDAITVANGHAFVVELPITTGTGYEWTAVTVPDLQQMTTKTVQRENRPGAQATQRITFRAQSTAAGTTTTTLTLNYARSFEPDVPPAKTATYSVTIT